MLGGMSGDVVVTADVVDHRGGGNEAGGGAERDENLEISASDPVDSAGSEVPKQVMKDSNGSLEEEAEDHEVTEAEEAEEQEVTEGQPTEGDRVQQVVDDRESSVHVDIPADAPTGLQKMYKDQTYYNAKPEHQAWSSRITFILASIGCAVGVGNIWRFPYMCYRSGGAAFLIPYFIAVFTLGYPLFVLETAIGQGTGKGPVGALGDLDPRLKGLAWLGFAANCSITCYYMVVIAWSFRYLVHTFLPGPLPYSQGRAAHFLQSVVLDKTFFCSPRSNSTGPQPNRLENPMPWDQAQDALSRGYDCRDSTFYDEGGLQGFNVLVLLIVWLLVLGMVFAGTKSLKYSVFITLPLPYIVLVIMFFRAITLPGAGTGIKYYVTPDISILFNDRYDAKTGEVMPAINIWLSAVSHIFYSLGLGQGMLITYSSYNPSHYPIMSNSWIVTLANSFTEIFGGFATFGILGYLAEQRGLHISEVVAAGPGLVFEAIPEALALMPAPAFFSFLFFFMLFLLGISSAIGMFESIVCVVRNQLSDKSNKSAIARYLVSKHWILPIVCSLVIGLPGLLFCRRSAEAWIDLVDGTVSFFLLSLIGVGEFIAVAWIFGFDNFSSILQHRTGFKPNGFHRFIWRWWGPALLLTLFFVGIGGAIKAPVTRVGWALAFGWSLALGPLGFAIWYFFHYPDHDGEHLNLRTALKRRKWPSSTPSYERTPWKIYEMSAAQGKDTENDVSEQGIELETHGSDNGEDASSDCTGDASTDRLTRADSKKGQKAKLIVQSSMC